LGLSDTCASISPATDNKGAVFEKNNTVESQARMVTSHFRMHKKTGIVHRIRFSMEKTTTLPFNLVGASQSAQTGGNLAWQMRRVSASATWRHGHLSITDRCLQIELGVASKNQYARIRRMAFCTEAANRGEQF